MVLSRSALTRLFGPTALLLCATALSFGLAGCAGSQTAPSQQNASPVVEEQVGASGDGQESASSAAEGTANSEASWYDNEDVGIGVVPESQFVEAADLSNWIEQESDVQVIDLRSVRSFATDGHIPTAKNVPTGRQFDIRMDEVRQDGPVVLVSDNEDHMATAWQTLIDAGYRPQNVMVLSGGMQSWMGAGLAVQEEELLKC